MKSLFHEKAPKKNVKETGKRGDRSGINHKAARGGRRGRVQALAQGAEKWAAVSGVEGEILH